MTESQSRMLTEAMDMVFATMATCRINTECNLVTAAQKVIFSTLEPGVVLLLETCVSTVERISSTTQPSHKYTGAVVRGVDYPRG